MHCDEATERMHAWLDGELPADVACEVAEHVESCPDCSAARRTYADLRAELKRLATAVDVPPSLARSIAARTRPRPWRTQMVRVAAAAAILVAGIGIGMWVRPAPVPASRFDHGGRVEIYKIKTLELR